MQSYHLRHQKTISKLHFLSFFHNQKGKIPHAHLPGFAIPWKPKKQANYKGRSCWYCDHSVGVKLMV